MADKQYLEWHGNQWRVRIKVPAAAQRVLGKKKLVHPLHTDSLTEANRKKKFEVMRFQAMIQAALRPDAVSVDQLEAEARRFRKLVLAEREAPPKIDYDDPEYPEGIVRQDEADGLVDRAYEIEEKFGPERAQSFYRYASGQVTPLKEHLDAWLNEKDFTGRTKYTHRRTVADLEAWCRNDSIEPTLEAVTRKVAGRFITESLIPGRSVKTINKHISALSTYWKWLMKRGHASENPWAGQSLAKPRRHLQRKLGGKRPYTDEEVRTLVHGPATPLLRDAMKIAALSGMRIEEICSLRVADCAEDCFSVTRAKSPAGVRKVPIHSALREIVTARLDGKCPNDRIFDELPEPPKSRAVDGRYSDPLSQAFTRYRRELGIDDRPEGEKQSNVDFHSFRRWFATKAHQALQNGATGFTPWTIADVLGHDREQMALSMTLGRYAAPSEEQARRACVEAVRLLNEL